MGIRQRIGEVFSGGRQVVSEIIGRVSYTAAGLYSRWLRADDRTQADYEWYDNLRHGKLPTYRLGALFAKPITSHIMSWSMGDGFRVMTDDDTTTEALNDLVNERLVEMIEFIHDGLDLGDSYLVINADGTFSAVPANQVEVITDDLDYRRVTAYVITTVLEKATITDRYDLVTGRTVTIERVNAPNEVFEYPLVSGRLPVVHFPNMRKSNEIHGRPFVEALVPLFAEYDDILLNSLTGVKTMSNPMPSLEGVADPSAELAALATRTETYEDASGVTRTESVVDMDALEIVATSGSFNFRGPAPFTADAWQMLKALFYLMLQHSHIPEWVWGGAIASSMASVEAQMPAWTKFIGGQRRVFEKYLREVLEIWLATVSLYTPGVQAGLDIEIEWPPVAAEDRQMHLNYVKHAGDKGLITGQTELELLDLVKDARAEYAAAKSEAEARMAARDLFGDMWERELAAAQEAAAARGQDVPGEDMAA